MAAARAADSAVVNLDTVELDLDTAAMVWAEIAVMAPVDPVTVDPAVRKKRESHTLLTLSFPFFLFPSVEIFFL